VCVTEYDVYVLSHRWVVDCRFIKEAVEKDRATARPWKEIELRKDLQYNFHDPEWMNANINYSGCKCDWKARHFDPSCPLVGAANDGMYYFFYLSLFTVIDLDGWCCRVRRGGDQPSLPTLGGDVCCLSRSMEMCLFP
jgi:hypothetical protein